MKTHLSTLLLALRLALCGPLAALAATDVVVQPLDAPDSLPPGPVCVLPPLVEAPPTPQDGSAATEPAEPPLLCACLPLDVLSDGDFPADWAKASINTRAWRA